jgi:hypothetical protein
MAQILPLTNDSCRKVTVSTVAGLLVFRTYYLPLIGAWLCDIADASGNALLSGLNLAVKVDNLLKGQGDKFNGYTLRVYSLSGGECRTKESLGQDCKAVLFGPEDAIPGIYE